MSHFDRLLQDDLNRLIDRIAVRAGEGTAASLRPDLRAHIEAALAMSRAGRAEA